jgi:hypothetical protein
MLLRHQSDGFRVYVGTSQFSNADIAELQRNGVHVRRQKHTGTLAATTH